MEQKTKEVISQLKSVRQEKGMSLQDIVEQCAANGSFVSLSSVRRVFADDSENAGFRYETTIQPIARVVLGLDETEEEIKSEPHTLTEIETENAAIKTVVSLNEKIIASKERENEQLQASNDALSAQLAARENSIEYLKKQVTEQRRALWGACGLVIFLLLLIIFALVIDKLNPDMGFFWLH